MLNLYNIPTYIGIVPLYIWNNLEVFGSTYLKNIIEIIYLLEMRIINEQFYCITASRIYELTQKTCESNDVNI